MRLRQNVRERSSNLDQGDERPRRVAVRQISPGLERAYCFLNAKAKIPLPSPRHGGGVARQGVFISRGETEVRACGV